MGSTKEIKVKYPNIKMVVEIPGYTPGHTSKNDRKLKVII